MLKQDEIRLLLGTTLLALALAVAGCGEDAGPGVPEKPGPGPTPADTIPPANIDDLVASLPAMTALTLTWTAPGDDGAEGTADSYDIRYAAETITEQNWDAAFQLQNEPRPREAGQKQSLRVSGLDVLTDYYFAIKATDEAANTSGLSNCCHEKTLPENTPPNGVSDLKATALDDNTMMLIWTTPGDDGNTGQAQQYEVLYEEGAFGDIDWETATPVADVPSPKMAGELDTLTVNGLDADTNYRFAIKTADEVPNWSETSNIAGELGYSVMIARSAWFTPIGETVDIMFRAEAGKWVTLRAQWWPECDVVDYPMLYFGVIADHYYATGTHVGSWDFRHHQTGEFVNPGTYTLMLCWGGVKKATISVILDSE